MARTERSERQVDTLALGNRLMVIAILLSVAGIVVLLSATSISAQAEHLSSYAYLPRQAMRVLIGLGVMWLASRFDYHRLRPLSILALLVTAGLLVCCLLPGTRGIAPLIGGARRWIHLGPISFQPSELAKFFLVIWAAGYLVRKRELIHRLGRGLMPFLVFTGIFFLLVVRQPDLSMAAFIMVVVVGTGFLGGIRLSHLLLVGLLALPLVTYKYVMGVGYRNERLTSFLDSGEEDRSGIGYQAYQSKLALGSGGLAGVGLGQSRQKYFYLPEAHTDFIFSIIGEELGFLGTTFVIGAFIFLAVLGARIALHAADYYGFLLAAGLSLMIFLSALLHMAVTSGLTPTTGMPLPFFSYGGTHLVTTLWGVGIIHNISRQAQEAQHVTA